MRAKKYFFCTLKETSQHTDTISHQLMLRSGMIRKLNSGIYTWLPTGLRVLEKVKNIIREELNKIDAIEIYLPILQPSYLWEISKRYNTYGKELLKISDRRNHSYILGPTHEEVITYLMKYEVQSYKELPIVLYQIQTKFRDEIRPRCGVMRSKEFIMKDAYSFHINKSSLKKTYYSIYKAYIRIFQRMQIHVKEIQADNGAMGGNISHEFHAITNNGDNNIIYSEESNNTAIILNSENINNTDLYQKSNNIKHNKKSFKTLLIKSSCIIHNSIKMILVKNNFNVLTGLLIHHNYKINKKKLEKINIFNKSLTLATKKEIYDLTGSDPEFIGPIGLNIPLIADLSVIQMKDFIIGSNIKNKYFYNINWEKDLKLPEIADITTIMINNVYCNKKDIFYIKRSVEIGHIFQLEQKYSKKINTTVLSNNGDKKFLHMGCYGIGITRIIAAIIEQNHDKKGIIWNDILAPFQVAILPINLKKSIIVKNISESLYLKLKEKNIEVIFDDRNLRPGVMFSEFELLGIPHFIIISERNIQNNNIEYKSRVNNSNKIIPIKKIIDFIIKIISKNSEI